MRSPPLLLPKTLPAGSTPTSQDQRSAMSGQVNGKKITLDKSTGDVSVKSKLVVYQ